jgi:outer membrane protein OmpA-like peptidoglycan-associated protein
VLADRATRKARIAEAHGDSAVEHPVVVARTRPRAEVVDNTPPDRMYERSEHVKVRTNDRRANASLQSLAQVANVKETPRGAVITLSGSLLFPSGQEDVSAIGNQSLDQVAHALAQQPSDTSFKVEGYTDSTGSESQNLELSNQRAQAVADRLAEAGIDASRVRAEGRGEAQPIADNTTPEGRATNRRIEIVMSRP